MSGVNFPTSNVPSGNPYIDGADGADAGRKAGGVSQNPIVPDAPEGKGDVFDRGFVPDAPSANVDMTALSGMMVATLSPGALLAALCVKEAAQQNEQNTKELLKRNDAVVKDMNQQADNIKAGALKQMIFQIAGAVASGVGSAVAGVKTLKIAPGTEGLALNQQMVKVNNWTQAGKSLDQALGAVGTYLNAREQADNKRLDANIEQHRTMMEALRNSMQAQRDLISKSLEFMNSMQSNMNQTMSRIMG